MSDQCQTDFIFGRRGLRHTCVGGGLLSNERTPKMATRSTSFQPGSSVVLTTVYSPATSITMMTTNAAMSARAGRQTAQEVTRDQVSQHSVLEWTVRWRSVEHV